MHMVEYCYVVTCEVLETFNAKVSGCCYHDFKNAVRFIESRSDKPKKVDEKNPFIWIGERWIYKIHTLTFDD